MMLASRLKYFSSWTTIAHTNHQINVQKQSFRHKGSKGKTQKVGGFQTAEAGSTGRVKIVGRNRLGNKARKIG